LFTSLVISFTKFGYDRRKEKKWPNNKKFLCWLQNSFSDERWNYVEGLIKEIMNDSVFVSIYDIRTFITSLGVNMIDTVTSYILGVCYKEIVRIKIFEYHRFVRGKIDKI
jgi:hypothetical protein